MGGPSSCRSFYDPLFAEWHQTQIVAGQRVTRIHTPEENSYGTPGFQYLSSNPIWEYFFKGMSSSINTPDYRTPKAHRTYKEILSKHGMGSVFSKDLFRRLTRTDRPVRTESEGHFPEQAEYAEIMREFSKVLQTAIDSKSIDPVVLLTQAERLFRIHINSLYYPKSMTGLEWTGAPADLASKSEVYISRIRFYLNLVKFSMDKSVEAFNKLDRTKDFLIYAEMVEKIGNDTIYGGPPSEVRFTVNGKVLPQEGLDRTRDSYAQVKEQIGDQASRVRMGLKNGLSDLAIERFKAQYLGRTLLPSEITDLQTIRSVYQDILTLKREKQAPESYYQEIISLIDRAVVQ